MSITFYCSECTQKLRIDDDFSGKLVACTRCGAKLRVPSPELPAAAPQAARAEVERAAAPVPQAAPAIPVEPPGRVESALRPFEVAAARMTRTGRKAAGRAKKAREEPLVKPAMKIDFEELIDMTAMVDIVFFLLIFFLVTSMKAIDSTIPMPSPDPQKAAARESRSLSELEADNEYITVHIDRNDTITIEGAEIHNDRDLLFKLRDLRTSGSRPEKMLVVGHGEASHGMAVMVLDAGRETGIEQVRLAVADDTE